MAEQRTGFPEFPKLYTESDEEQLAQLQEQATKLKELYHAHYHDPVWESKPWLERFARGVLNVPREHLPGLDRVIPHLTQESVREERYRLEGEIKHLDNLRYAQERAPEIMEEMLALAIGGNFIGDRGEFFGFFPDGRRFPDEMTDYLMNYGIALSKADPKDLLSGDFWGETAPQTEVDYRAYWEMKELSPTQVLSSIAFSQDVEEIRQALTYAYPPSEHVAIPDDQMDAEWYKYLEDIFEQHKLSFDRENPSASMETLSLVQLYTNGVPHSFLSEDGTPMVDENGEPLQGRLYPGSNNPDTGEYIPATVWYGDELMGVYDEAKGEFVPWSIVTMQPYASEEEQEEVGLFRSQINQTINQIVLYGYGVVIATPMAVANQLASIFSLEIGALPILKGIIRGQLKKIPYYEWIEEKITEQVAQTTIFQKYTEWRDDQADKVYEVAHHLSGRVIEAQIAWYQEKSLPVMEGVGEPIVDRYHREGGGAAGIRAIVTDVPYFSHILTESVSSMAISMLTMLGVTKLTKNPTAGRIASGYLIGAAETGRIVQILHEEGIPPEDIAMWAQVLVPILGGLEVAGAEIMLRALSPRIYHEMFGRKFIQELVRGTVREMVRSGIKQFTFTEVSETAIEVSVHLIGNTVLHHEGLIENVFEDTDEVAIRTAISFLGSSSLGGYTHTRYLHQNFVEAGLYDTHMAQVAQLEQAGLSHEMADILSALKLVETTEGAKAKAKTYRQLEPTFRRAAKSPELIQAVHQVEAQFRSTDTKSKALDQQVSTLEKAVKHHERVLARTSNPTKIAKRQAILDQVKAELVLFKEEQTSTTATRESLVKQLSYLDTMALVTGKMTQRIWDTRPADAKRIYLKEIGLEGDEVGIADAGKAWDDLSLEIRSLLESHESQRLANPESFDPNSLSADKIQQIESLRQQQEVLEQQMFPLRKAVYDKLTEVRGLEMKKRLTPADQKRLDTLNRELSNLKANILPLQDQMFALQEQERGITQLSPITAIEDIKFTDSIDGEVEASVKDRLISLLETVRDSSLRFEIKEIKIDHDMPFPGYRDKLGRTPQQAMGIWSEDTKTMTLEPGFRDDTFYHEIAHAIASRDVNEGRFDFWRIHNPKFAVEMQKKLVDLKKKGMISPRPLGGDADLLYTGWKVYKDAEEAYARAFEKYYRQVDPNTLQANDYIDLMTYLDTFKKHFNVSRKMQENNLGRDTIKAHTEIRKSEEIVKIATKNIDHTNQLIAKLKSQIDKGGLTEIEIAAKQDEIVSHQVTLFKLENTKTQEEGLIRVKENELESMNSKLALLDQGKAPPPSNTTPVVYSPDQFPMDDSNGLAKLPSIEAILAQRALHLKKHPEIADRVAIPIDIHLMDDKSISYQQLSTMPIFRKWFKGHLDSKYILMNLEARTGRPFYTLYDLMRQVHGQVEHASRVILERISKVPDFQTILSDDASIKRVEQLIASENPKFKVSIPENLTQLELNFAQAVKDVFNMYRPKINVLAFEKAYEANHGDVDGIMKMMKLGDEHKVTVEKAVTMTRRGELTARNNFVKNLDWGVIEGYTPWMVVVHGLNRSSKEYTSRRRGEGRLKHRYGIEIPDMSSSLTERIEQYVRQIESQWQMKDLLDAFETHLGEVDAKMDNPGSMYDDMSKFIQEIQHFPPPEAHSGGANFIQRMYASVAVPIFHTNPRVLLRNSLQILTFHPWRTYIPKGIRAKHYVDAGLLEKSKIYYKACVSQMTGIQRGIFFHGHKPLYADVPLFGKPLYNLARLINRVAPYGRSDDIPRHWSFNAGMVRVSEAVQSYKKHGNIDTFIRESGIETLRRPQQDLVLQYLAIGEDYVNMGIEGLQQVTGYEAAAIYTGKEIADLTHFNYERAFRAPIEMGTTGRTIFNLLTFTRSYWQRHYHNGLKWANKDWAEHYTPTQRLTAFRDSLSLVVAGAIVSSYLRELFGRPYRSYWIGDIMWWEMGGLLLGVVNQLGSAMESLTRAIDPHTEEEERWRAVRAATGFFLKEGHELYVPFLKIFLDSLEAGAMRGHLPEEFIEYDLRAYQAIRAHFDKNYTPAEIEVREIELMEAIQKSIFSTPPPDLDRVIEASRYLEERRMELGVVYTSEPGKVGVIYELGNFLSDVESYIRKQNIPRDMITTDNGFHPLVEFALDYLYLLDEFNDLPTQPARVRTEWRKQNPEFELLLIFWERFGICKIPYGSAQGQQIEEAIRALDAHFKIPAMAARSRLNNWRYAIIIP